MFFASWFTNQNRGIHWLILTSVDLNDVPHFNRLVGGYSGTCFWNFIHLRCLRFMQHSCSQSENALRNSRVPIHVMSACTKVFQAISHECWAYHYKYHSQSTMFLHATFSVWATLFRFWSTRIPCRVRIETSHRRVRLHMQTVYLRFMHSLGDVSGLNQSRITRKAWLFAASMIVLDFIMWLWTGLLSFDHMNTYILQIVSNLMTDLRPSSCK